MARHGPAKSRHRSRETIPHLTRSSLRHCLKRHGISRLPCGLVDSPNRATASALLFALIAAVPNKIRTIWADNGIRFRYTPRYRSVRRAGKSPHISRCAVGRSASSISLRAQPSMDQWSVRKNEPNHQGHHGQALPLQQPRSTLAPSHRFRQHLPFRATLEALKDLTPYEQSCKQWTSEPGRYQLDPIHQMPRLNPRVPRSEYASRAHCGEPSPDARFCGPSGECRDGKAAR